MVTSTQNATTSAAALLASMNGSANPSTSVGSAADTQDRFLKLLVTQMKNQDPLNPMDNAQVTSQMAQLSTVTGIDKLNATLQALSDSMTSNQSLQAASMIGHGVLVAGNGVDLASGVGVGGFDLTQSVESARVSIYDKSGALVRTIDLGAQPAGIGNWQWDGKNGSGADMAAGSYTFAVNAMSGGTSTTATSLQFGMVNSVTQKPQGALLSVGQLEGIAMSQIKQIF
jgi:flagellar basal-body rod modification protein FlgD